MPPPESRTSSRRGGSVDLCDHRRVCAASRQSPLSPGAKNALLQVSLHGTAMGTAPGAQRPPRVARDIPSSPPWPAREICRLVRRPLAALVHPVAGGGGDSATFDLRQMVQLALPNLKVQGLVSCQTVFPEGFHRAAAAGEARVSARHGRYDRRIRRFLAGSCWRLF